MTFSLTRTQNILRLNYCFMGKVIWFLLLQWHFQLRAFETEIRFELNKRKANHYRRRRHQIHQKISKSLFHHFVRKAETKNANSRASSIAEWFFPLHPQSSGHGFKSQAHHLSFFNLYYLNCYEKRTKINKKRPGLAYSKNKSRCDKQISA